MAKKPRERINIRLPADLTAVTRRWAKKHNTNFTAAVERALTEFIQHELYFWQLAKKLSEREKGKKLRAADL
jgi:hypothetical protein